MSVLRRGHPGRRNRLQALRPRPSTCRSEGSRSTTATTGASTSAAYRILKFPKGRWGSRRGRPPSVLIECDGGVRNHVALDWFRPSPQGRASRQGGWRLYRGFSRRRDSRELFRISVVFAHVITSRYHDTSGLKFSESYNDTGHTRNDTGRSRIKVDSSSTKCRRSAQSYLELRGFSRQGLIDQLSSEYGGKFNVEDSTVAVDSLDVDWNAQAVRSAKSYLELKGFSCQGLIDQLSSEYGSNFTLAQATYGATQAGIC